MAAWCFAQIGAVVSDHFFGNSSTDLKLQVIDEYLNAYTQALRNKFGQLWYIDAFAGTGTRTVTHGPSANLFDQAAREAFREQRRGSARIAIDANPAFDRLIFIDQKRGHVKALEALKAENPARSIDVVRGDCNLIIPAELARQKWGGKRAVMFLDPYGLNVDWTTLEAIRQTNAIDVWYLVNINAILRQAARSRSAVDINKQKRLTRMFGTDAWRTDWYDLRPAQADMFTGQYSEDFDRIADEEAIEKWVHRRLMSLFPWVSPNPLRMFMDKGSVHQFSLFFAVSNSSGPALGLAQRLANHVLKKGISSQVRPS